MLLAVMSVVGKRGIAAIFFLLNFVNLAIKIRILGIFEMVMMRNKIMPEND